MTAYKCFSPTSRGHTFVHVCTIGRFKRHNSVEKYSTFVVNIQFNTEASIDVNISITFSQKIRDQGS